MRDVALHALALAMLLAGRLAADPFEIKVYMAPRIAAPVLDGRLDEAGWQQAPLAGGFTLFGKDDVSEPPTFFRVAFDAENLYLGVQCDEPALKQLVPEPQPRDAHDVFHGETIEVFVDPAHSHSRYYQFAVNSAASIYDSCGEDPTWSATVRAAVAMAADGWSLELAVPWRDLGVQPRSGALLGLNVCRDRYLGDRQWSNWSRTTTGFHDPLRFGHVVLDAAPEALAALTNELRQGERTGPIVLYTRDGLASASYRGLVAAALAGLGQEIETLRQQATGEASPGARAELVELADTVAAQAQEVATRLAEPRELDARAWHALDRQVATARRTLSQAVWVARLNALLADL